MSILNNTIINGVLRAPTIRSSDIVTENISASQLTSTVATGTAPFVVSSTTQVANLNSNLLNGYSGSAANTANTYVLRNSSNYIYTGYINSLTDNNENPTINQFVVTNGIDNFYRKASISHVRNALGTNENTPSTLVARDTSGGFSAGKINGIDLSVYYGSLATSGWLNLGGRVDGGKLTISYNNGNAAWTSGAYSSTLLFGNGDIKGFVDCSYNKAVVSFGGCSKDNSTDDAPFWYMKLSGTNASTYNLDNFLSTSGKAASAVTADSAAIATKVGTADCLLYPQNNNEINFGGTNSTAIIFFGYRGVDSRPSPTEYNFSNGKAKLTAGDITSGGCTMHYDTSTESMKFIFS